MNECVHESYKVYLITRIVFDLYLSHLNAYYSDYQKYDIIGVKLTRRIHINHILESWNYESCTLRMYYAYSVVIDVFYTKNLSDDLASNIFI